MGLTKSQRALVSQFQTVTGSTSKSAQQFLEASGWNSEVAFNDYLDLGGESSFMPPSTVDQAKISQLFDRYRDKQNQDIILAEGIEAFCQDLQVDPADVVMLVVSFYMAAENSCEFTRGEFTTGMKELEADSLSKLKGQIPALRRQLKDPSKFQLLFAERPWPLLALWCSFLQEHHKRAISRDTWVQLLEFVTDVEPDLSNFDQNAGTSAWPYLIDEFAEYVQSKRESSSSDVVVID